MREYACSFGKATRESGRSDTRLRYFVRQHERLIEDHKRAREAYQESLRGVVAERSGANAKLIVCLDNNTKVLEECRDELRLVRMERNR